MILNEKLVAGFLRCQSPELTDGEAAKLERELLGRIRDGGESFADRFVAVESGKVVAAAALIKVQESVFLVKTTLGGGDFKSAFSTLLADALARLGELRAAKAHLRIVKDGSHGAAAGVLSGLGFVRLNERIEYRTPVENLPSDKGSPIQWVSLGQKAGPDLRRAAGLLEICGKGDPDWSPEDDAFQQLEAYLSDPALRTEPDCVERGMVDGKDAAIVIAQVNPTTGWSRITYMGVVPERRGQGLGRWAHRHGFEMMRRQKGRVYHGGTLVDNHAMVRLFQEHGCVEHRRVEEWVRQRPWR